MDSADEKKALLSEGTSRSYSDPTDPESIPKSSAKAATFSDLFRFATWWDKVLIFFGTLFSAAHGGGWPLLSIVFGDMTNQFVLGTGGENDTNTTQLPNDTLAEYNKKMTEYALYQVYIGLGVMVAGYFQVMCWTTASERQVHKLRLHYYYSILKQEIKWFDQQQSGALTTRLADDLERVKEGIGDKISFTIQYLAAFFSGFAIGFWKSWKMSLVMMSLTPLLAFGMAMMSKFMTSFTKREQETYAEAGSIAEETLSCIRTVISFNGQRQERDRYESSLTLSTKLGIRKGSLQGSMMGFTMFVMFGSYALAFWYGTEQVKEWYETGEESGLSPGEVLTVFFCVMIGSMSLGNAAPSVGSVFTAKGAAAELIKTMENQPSIDVTSSSGRKLDKIDGNIRLENVDFSYPAQEKRPEKKVLKNMNFDVKPGQTVALVGPSGCGKSTIMSLILRLYDPMAGQVTIDGVDVKDMNVCWLRRNIGVVSQEPVLFGYTIAENIKLGNPDATIQDIQKAAREANAHDFISSLPEGYNTLVGERGAQLSGGQKQRVAIARALVRDPRIILLDEATSALDTESEKVVQSALDRARVGRTTIVIAHRLSTVQNADVIFVVDDGKIHEQGTHGDLMKKQDLYYELVMAQTLAEDQDELIEEEEEEEENEAESTDKQGEFDQAKDKAKILRRSRSRVSSSEDKHKKMSRQFSRQFSKLSEKDKPVDASKKEEVEEEEYEPPKYLRLLRSNTPECAFIIFGSLGAAIGGCIMPGFALFFGQMIEVFINKGKDSLLWSMMFLALGGTQLLTQTVMSSSFAQSGERLTKRLRGKVFTSYLRQDVAYFDDPKHSTGAMTTRLATDASMIKNATGIRIAVVLQSLVSLIAALTIAFIFGWELALVVIGGIPIMSAAGFLQLKVVTGQHKGDQSTLENAGKVASESIENIRTVQSLSREEYFFTAYRKSLLQPYRHAIKQAQLYGLAFAFSSGVIFLLYGGCFRFGAYMVSLGRMEPDNVFK